MPSKNAPAANHELTFESAVERLETIVEQMESSKLPLEELLARYEEGVKLVKVCSEKLNAAEQKISIISRAANGELREEPFEPEKKSAQTEEVSLF